MREPKPQQRAVHQERSFDWLALGCALIALGHYLSAMAPGVWTWGLDYWSVIPFWAQSLLLLLVALVLLPGLPEGVAALFERRTWPRGSAWVAVAVAAVLFVVFRSRGYSYGDGYSFRGYFVGSSLPDIGGNLALMGGDLVVHWLVYRLAVMPLGGSIETAYAIVSAVAGLASLFAVSRIARVMFPRDRGARWSIVAAAFSSGMAVLWFGHVEAYSLVGAALLWCVALLAEKRVGLAWGVWILACAMHLLAMAFLPVLIWAMWGKTFVKRLKWLSPAVVFLIGFVGWAISTTIFGVVRPGIFVPLLATADSAYTAFSLHHLTDVANLLLFVAPLGLVGLAVWLLRKPRERPDGEDDVIAILAVASACLWYFAFWVDPLIGAFRDWDLIGVFGIPFSILGIALLLNRVRAQGAVRPQWVVIAVFAIAHTGGFVATVQSEASAMERVDRLVREDSHYSRDFHRGERLMSWSFILTEVLDRKDLAIFHLRNRSAWEPMDVKSWGNLGSMYWKTGQYDSATVSFEQALKLNPDDAKTVEQLAFAYSGAKNWSDAMLAVQKLSTLRELKVEELNLMAFCLLTVGDDAGADSILDKSLSLNPNQQEAFYYRGIASERQGDTTEALENYERAMIPSTNVEDVYLRCTKLYNALMRSTDGERVASAWQEQFPNSPTPGFFLGIFRIGNKQYAGAKEALERSASLDPTNPYTQFYLATTYRNLGELEKAGGAARRSAALDSTIAIPYLELIYLAADAGDRPAAVAATREFLRRSPGDSGMSYLQQFMEP